jgi:prepilin-type processing-associated H-X9-DG protein
MVAHAPNQRGEIMPRHADRSRRHAFTFVDLLVVMLIVCLLTGYVFSAGGLMRARETSSRVKCASNLRQIGQAMLLYANENKGAYPRTYFVPDEAPTQYTGVGAKDPFAKEGAPTRNDVTAPMYLLIRTEDLPAQAFVCPVTDAQPLKYVNINELQRASNFKSEESLSYSMANPYPSKDAINSGFKWNNTLGPEFATAADMNPGKVEGQDVTKVDVNFKQADIRLGNSLNHRADGQNVLYGDGHVEFQQNPFCGIKRDNIYTVAGAGDGTKPTSPTIAGPPAWAGDSVLLPASTANPRKKTPDEEEAAAIKDFKEQLPRMKAILAQQELRNGATPQVREAKQRLAEMEKEAAEVEAKQKK